ncbi:MAG: hypothetical protein ABEI96_08355 [Haloarculaceae archaeon]
MDRRRFLGWCVGCTTLGCAGCSAPDTGRDTTTRSPRQVTTTGAADVDVLVAQIVVDDRSSGPDAYYRLRNTGDADATIRVETVLSIEGGGTYSAFAFVTVPAGDDVTVRYRIVRFEDLSESERLHVRRGEGVTFEVFVNGRRREDV